MTPERIKELALIQASRNRPYYPDETVEVLGDEWSALLAIAQRAGETCEWVREDWANFKGAQFQTNCGKKIHAEHDKSRPCWCGRTVAVRDGRT